MKTGLLIRELRIKKGLTQEELAEKTELSARTIQRIENGEVDPRSYTLQMIAKALDVDFSLFVENESEEKEEFQKVGGNNWSAQWVGFITAPADGRVTFCSESNKEFILAVSGQTLVHVAPGGGQGCGSVSLAKGEEYPIDRSGRIARSQIKNYFAPRPEEFSKSRQGDAAV